MSTTEEQQTVEVVEKPEEHQELKVKTEEVQDAQEANEIKEIQETQDTQQKEETQVEKESGDTKVPEAEPVKTENQEPVSSSTTKPRMSSRRPSHPKISRGYPGSFQNYGLAYLPYKSNFEPSEEARRRADEFLKTLKI